MGEWTVFQAGTLLVLTWRSRVHVRRSARSANRPRRHSKHSCSRGQEELLAECLGHVGQADAELSLGLGGGCRVVVVPASTRWSTRTGVVERVTVERLQQVRDRGIACGQGAKAAPVQDGDPARYAAGFALGTGPVCHGGPHRQPRCWLFGTTTSLSPVNDPEAHTGEPSHSGGVCAQVTSVSETSEPSGRRRRSRGNAPPSRTGR